MSGQPKFFKTPADFRSWLEENHEKEEVLWVGYYKVNTGKPSMRWEESVREALCFGWIDGLRKSIDKASYKIRFTPRKPGSHWSAKNIKMVKELIDEGRLRRAGLMAFKRRDEKRSRRASYEQQEIQLKEEYLQKIRENEKAWTFFRELAPGYTKTSIHWVMSAKREETRLKRLKILIDSCVNKEKIPPLRR